jgi:hypothetical protein
VVLPGREFPGLVVLRQAPSARAVARGDRSGFVGEEHPVTDVAAAGDRAQGGRAVEAAVQLAAPPGVSL